MQDVRQRHFEKIGLQQKLFSRQQLAGAMRASKTGGVSPGEAMIQQGVLTREQLRGLERAVIYRIGRDEDKAVAKIIIDSNYCPEEAVEEALRKQKDFYAKTGELMRLGMLLIEARDLSESQRVAAHKIHGIEQSGVPGFTVEPFNS